MTDAEFDKHIGDIDVFGSTERAKSFTLKIIAITLRDIHKDLKNINLVMHDIADMMDKKELENEKD